MRMDRGVDEAESIKRKPESEQCGGRGLWEVVGDTLGRVSGVVGGSLTTHSGFLVVSRTSTCLFC